MRSCLNSEAWLAPGIHMTLIDEDLVVLDVQSDAYACLVGGSEYVQLLADNRIGVSHREVLEDLIAANWLTTSATNRSAPSASVPRRSREGSGQANLRDLIRVGLDTHISAAVFRRQSFAELLETARRLRRKADDAGPFDMNIIDRTVAAFTTLRPWLPNQGVCLQRSFCLLQCLSRRGVVANWVFGVRTWPFAAHCWLQVGDEVIGDDLDRISAYAPILVV